MSGVVLTISPKIIDWVIETVELYHSGVNSLELLKKWKSGEKQPTFSQIRDISNKVNIPFGYFFLEDPPEVKCHVIDFRTVDSIELINPSKNLLDTIDTMTEAQDWMVDYIKNNYISKLSYVGAVNENWNVHEAAAYLRNTLGLNEQWNQQCRDGASAFRYVKKRISDSGTLVMMNGVVGSNTHRKLSVEEFRAFTLINEYAPLIFINSVDTDNGKLFSILHEFVHVLLGKHDLYNASMFVGKSGDKVEAFCNAVAAEVLIPDSAFIKQWNALAVSLDERVMTLSKYFRCSRYVVIRKALNNNMISRAIYLQFVKSLDEQIRDYKQKSDKGGGDYYRNKCSQLDRNLVFALNASVKEGKTQFTEAFRITKTNAKTFDKMIAEFGGSW